ncbi:MAG: hypothetical protein KGP28_03880 [Bdellovibrionales bacterium]|nr:hypothetical protein [Bdellovibrionales bacterium]
MSADQILERFNLAAPWTRFDEWTGIWIETTTQSTCVLFGEDQDSDFKMLVLRGNDPSFRFLQYRSGEWIPEFGLDFATTDGLRVSIIEDEVDSYLSCRPGLPPDALRLDEKQFLFEVFDAITYLVGRLDADEVPVLGETEDDCYHLWKVAGTWRAEVREFPEEQFQKFQPIEVQEARMKRIRAADLPQEGVWEAAPFFLPATRFQGNQEVFVQCAAVAERNSGLLGLVTLEAHASPEQEVAEALLGSIEQQKRLPQFLVVKDERLAERILPVVQSLGIQLRIRRRLRELELIREEMIEEFPDDDADEE